MSDFASVSCDQRPYSQVVSDFVWMIEIILMIQSRIRIAYLQKFVKLNILQLIFFKMNAVIFISRNCWLNLFQK